MRGIRKIKGSLLDCLVAAIISFACMPLVSSFAETVTYTYDSSNRLSRADYASGLSITYGYDGMGNMTQRVVASTDTTAPNAPVISSPTNGSVINASNVTLSGTAEASSMVKVYDGAVLLGGVTANVSGAWTYGTPLLGDGGHSFTATATDAAGNTSDASTAVAVTIQTSAPTTTASVAGGTYSSAQSVALTCFDGTGAGCDKIYYTLDGSTPTTSSSIYTDPISISSNTTLKYFATDLLGHNEAVQSQTYAFETTPPVTTANPAGGAYATTRSVELSCSDAGSGCDKIYYTTDGTTPTTSSKVYANQIIISATATLKFFAVDHAGNSEVVKTQTYFIETTPPVTTASPVEGTYYSMQTVTLTCADGPGSGCDKIYYTTDGTTPTTSSSVYTTPLNISSTTTLKYFAVDMAGNSEAVKSQVYTVYDISCTWINTAGGNWSTASNWSCGRAPTSNDHTHITMSGTYTITLDTNTTINSLNLGASSGTQTLSASGKTLTINTLSNIGSHGVMNLSNSVVSQAEGIYNNGTISLSTNSSLSGNGTITNSGTVSLSNGTINAALVNGGTLRLYNVNNTIGGALTTQSGSVMHMEASYNCAVYGSRLTVSNGFTNNGTIEFASGCNNNYDTTLVVTSGVLVNAFGGSIHSLTGSGTGTRTLTASINNQGAITIDYPLTINKVSATHTNSGAININANLTVSQSSGSFTNTGTIAVASGRTFSLTSGTFNQNTGATLSGAGELSLSSVTANFQTAIGVSTLSLSGSTANLTSDIDLGTMNLNLSTSTLNGPVTITNPSGKTLEMANSTINTALVNGGTLNIANVNNTIGGVFTTQSGSVVHIEGSHGCGAYNSRLTVSNGFTNNGTINLTNSCTGGYSATLVVTSGVLVNASGASINSLTGNGSGSRTLTASINNQGTMAVDYPLTINKSSATHTNSGAINVNANLTVSQSSSSFTNSGTIVVASGKTMSVSGGTFTNAASGTLGGAGTISFSSATFAQNGTINPGSNLGKLSITGTLPQSATSVVNMEIGGTTAGTTYDQLAVSGAATLNGTLNVSLVNGFTPNTGNSFTLLTYGSKTGTFSSVNLPSMGKLWTTTYNPTSMVLSVGDACPAITLAPASLSTLTVGTPFSQSITASGGVEPYTYSVSSGSLPSGLTLSVDGVLSGTPSSAGTYTFAVTGTGTDTCAGSVSYTVTVQTPCIAPPSGIVSWWQGEGDAGDQMSRNGGGISNGTTFTTGKVGQAFSFDGVDDAVLAGASGFPTADGERTMAMWVKIAQPAATDSIFAGYGNAGIGDQLYMLGATGSGNTLFFNNGTTTLSGPNLQNDRWYHVAVTNSGSLVTLYLDGAVVASDTLTLSTPAGTTFVMGYLDAGRKLNGAMDEVQVFDRALSATEITEIYNAGSNGLCDNVAPTVRSTGPANGATGTAINSPITAMFSEAMDANTINTANVTVNGGITGTVAYDAGTKTVTYTPSANLAYGTTYTATINTGVKDAAGNALAAGYSWSFTTEPLPDADAPTTTASPAGGTYPSPLSVTLSCSDGTGSGCDKIYYTTDGTTPTTASTVYTTAFSISTTTTLKYFAKDLAGNSEAIRSQVYTINVPPDISALPSSLSFATLACGNTSSAQTITVSNSASATALLSISSVSVSGNEYLIQSNNCTGATLTAGTSCSIQVAFKPTYKWERRTNVAIASNDPDTPILYVPLTGRGADTCPVDPVILMPIFKMLLE